MASRRVATDRDYRCRSPTPSGGKRCSLAENSNWLPPAAVRPNQLCVRAYVCVRQPRISGHPPSGYIFSSARVSAKTGETAERHVETRKFKQPCPSRGLPFCESRSLFLDGSPSIIPRPYAARDYALVPLRCRERTLRLQYAVPNRAVTFSRCGIIAME